jgi:hypothetical protein
MGACNASVSEDQEAKQEGPSGSRFRSAPVCLHQPHQNLLPQVLMGQQPITLKTSIGRIASAITVEWFDAASTCGVETF